MLKIFRRINTNIIKNKYASFSAQHSHGGDSHNDHHHDDHGHGHHQVIVKPDLNKSYVLTTPEVSNNHI